MISPLDFELPPELEAHDPLEARGRSREDVRLMVATRHDLQLVDARFSDLPRFLLPGDLLVINTSRTLPASIPVTRFDGMRLELHLSTPVIGEPEAVDLTRPPDPARDTWVVELRTPAEEGGRSFRGLSPGETLALPEASAEIVAPYPPLCGPREDWPRESRLWTARLRLPLALGPYLERHGRPIRYGYVSREWPASYYQTVYAAEAGSVEMPSAGRPFTADMITRLIAGGIDVAPITLHAGVASLEDHEPPLREWYRVPHETARRVSSTRASGGRVIAVGTTVVRALETIAAAAGMVAGSAVAHGEVAGGEGWTNLLVSPARGVRRVDGLLTGWHEPRASHLLMLEALAGRRLLELSYRAALERGYLWHEFGDLHLILP